MWMDGIITDKRKKARKRSRRKPRRKEPFTVSARMKEKNAERRKRFTVVILLVVVLVGFGWVVHVGLVTAGRYLFTENDKYRVEQWDLRSDGPLLSARYIREYSQLGEAENLFAINLEKVRQRLLSVPVVKRVEVSRRLPDTVVVRVNERLAVARVETSRGFSLAVDEEGFVLGPRSLRPNLPVIEGVDQPGLRPGIHITESTFVDALKVIELAERPKFDPHLRLRTIRVDHPENVDIILASGETVRVSRKHLEQRLHELVDIVREQKRRGRVAQLINMTGDAHIPPAVQY